MTNDKNESFWKLDAYSFFQKYSDDTTGYHIEHYWRNTGDVPKQFEAYIITPKDINSFDPNKEVDENNFYNKLVIIAPLYEMVDAPIAYFDKYDIGDGNIYFSFGLYNVSVDPNGNIVYYAKYRWNSTVESATELKNNTVYNTHRITITIQYSKRYWLEIESVLFLLQTVNI